MDDSFVDFVNSLKGDNFRHLLISNSVVGAAGFELATPCTPCKCATRLRYAPTENGNLTLTKTLSQ